LLDVLEAIKRPVALAWERALPAARPDLFTAALRLAASRLPASETEIRRRLARAHLSGFVTGLRWLEDVARMTRQPLPFTVIRGHGLVVAVSPALDPLARSTLNLATRAIRIAGLASARAIADRAGTSSLAFVRRLLQAHPGFAWLDRARDWFWFGNARHRALLALTSAPTGDPGAGVIPPPVRRALIRRLQGRPAQPSTAPATSPWAGPRPAGSPRSASR
jgi:hypothetical protein